MPRRGFASNLYFLSWLFSIPNVCSRRLQKITRVFYARKPQEGSKVKSNRAKYNKNILRSFQMDVNHHWEALATLMPCALLPFVRILSPVPIGYIFNSSRSTGSKGASEKTGVESGPSSIKKLIDQNIKWIVNIVRRKLDMFTFKW